MSDEPDPEAVRDATPGSVGDRTRYLNGSRVRATVDRDTQRLRRLETVERRVRYETDAMETVEDRGVLETTVTYHYEPVSVRGPTAPRLRLAALPWDLLYY
jgi:hypothetical protein